jgi:hypothetical protein
VYSHARGRPWPRMGGDLTDVKGAWLPTLSEHHFQYHYHCKCHHRSHFMHIGACLYSEGWAEQAALKPHKCEVREDRRNLKKMQPTAGRTEALKASTQQQGTQAPQSPAPSDKPDTPTIFSTNLFVTVQGRPAFGVRLLSVTAMY